MTIYRNGATSALASARAFLSYMEISARSDPDRDYIRALRRNQSRTEHNNEVMAAALAKFHLLHPQHFDNWYNQYGLLSNTRPEGSDSVEVNFGPMNGGDIPARTLYLRVQRDSPDYGDNDLGWGSIGDNYLGHEVTEPAGIGSAELYVLPEGLALQVETDEQGFGGLITPTPELMDTLSERARRHAVRSLPYQRNDSGLIGLYWAIDGENVTLVRTPIDLAETIQSVWGIGSGAELIEQAKRDYRAWIRMRAIGNVNSDTVEFERKRAEHREKTGKTFDAFRKAVPKVEERLIPTLPFVPHGLSSSRRWGIEVESGGARGVKSPKGWDRKYDGSLRSAWDGYKEVQDFEPYDEEVNERISWTACANSARHIPQEEYYDEQRSEWIVRVREDFLSAADCESCGQVTRTVRREPQTIVHSRSEDDCAEFVSPILVSMHSNGLQAITEELSKQPQNDTAGVHVHVEATDLSAKQIATLVYGYDMLENMLESSYQREKRQYCKRRDAATILDLARQVKQGEASTSRGDRYVTTNLNSLDTHGTVEFRAMGPVYDYEYLIRWAMFCREMVNVVAAGATHRDFGRIKKWSDVLALFAKFGKEYVRAAVYEMTGDKGKAATLVKEGKPVTNEALTEDLNELMASIASASSTAAGALRYLAGETVQLAAVSTRLVGVGNQPQT